MHSTIIICALPTELWNLSEIDGIPIWYSGVGKINSCMTAMKAVNHGYKKIINLGSAGSIKHKVGEILRIGKFYQDIDCSPLCDYGVTFDEEEYFLKIEEGNDTSCFTTDYFYDSSQIGKYSISYLESIRNNDLFEMESYSIAKVCKNYGIDFICYKWVSDDGRGSDWVKNNTTTLEKIRRLLSIS